MVVQCPCGATSLVHRYTEWAELPHEAPVRGPAELAVPRLLTMSSAKLNPLIKGVYVVLCLVTLISVAVYLSSKSKVVSRRGGEVDITMKMGVSSRNLSFTSLEAPQERYGYLLATDFVDQMTGSLHNFLDMQYWASTLGPRVRVVEPFIVHSYLGVNLDANETVKNFYSNEVRFRDVYDLNTWEKYISSWGYAPLVSWNEFIKNSPRKLIVVVKKSSSLKRFLDGAAKFARKYHFEMVRNVSAPLHRLQVHEYREMVYGKFDPSEVVVLYKIWGGFRYVSAIREVISIKQPSRGFKIPFSLTVYQDTEAYVSKYLHGNASYISVMLRMEYFFNNHNRFRGASKEEVLSVTNKCLDTIVNRVNALKAEHGVDSVLLTLDCRKHGSTGFVHPKGSKLLIAEATNSIFPRLFGDSLTPEQWDESFESVSSFITPGYVAMLQKQLAAKGTCLLTGGGGTFQSTTRTMYRQYHNFFKRCGGIVYECGFSN